MAKYTTQGSYEDVWSQLEKLLPKKDNFNKIIWSYLVDSLDNLKYKLLPSWIYHSKGLVQQESMLVSFVEAPAESSVKHLIDKINVDTTGSFDEIKNSQPVIAFFLVSPTDNTLRVDLTFPIDRGKGLTLSGVSQVYKIGPSKTKELMQFFKN